MAALVHQRCVQHPAREAASRCLECRGFFCRECVTEHDGRLLCRPCLGAASASAARTRRAPLLLWAAGAAAGTAFLWFVIYYTGVLFARLPSEFHEAVK